MNNLMQMIQQFNDFKRNFKGDPKEEVQRLVSQGKMSQSQLNQLQNMAMQFQQMLNGLK